MNIYFLAISFVLSALLNEPNSFADMSPVIKSAPQRLEKAGTQMLGMCSDIKSIAQIPICYSCANAIKKSAGTLDSFMKEAIAADEAAQKSTVAALGESTESLSLRQRALLAGASGADARGVAGLNAQVTQRQMVIASSSACKKDLNDGGCNKLTGAAASYASEAYKTCADMGAVATNEMGQLQTASQGATTNGNLAGLAAGQSGLSGILGPALGAMGALAPLAMAMMNKNDDKGNQTPAPQLAKAPANTVTADSTKSAVPVNGTNFTNSKGDTSNASIETAGRFNRGNLNEPADKNGGSGGGSNSPAFSGALSKTDGGGGGGNASGGGQNGGVPIAVKEKDKAQEDVRALDIGGNTKGPGAGAGSTSILGVNSKGNELENLVAGAPKATAEEEPGADVLQLPGLDGLGANNPTMSPLVAAALMEKDPKSIFNLIHTKMNDVVRRGAL